MGSVTKHYCDICKSEISPGGRTESGDLYSGHIKYRLYTPQGQQGDKIDLCPEHAAKVWHFIQHLREFH